MKSEDEALKVYLRDWFFKPHKPIGTTPPVATLDQATAAESGTIPTCSEEDWQTKVAEYMAAEPRPRRRGRPWMLDMNESFHAFLFINRQINYFKELNGVARCPEKVTNKFIEVALRTWFKNAVAETVQEFLREKKKYL